MSKAEHVHTSPGTPAEVWQATLRGCGLRATAARIVILGTLEQHGHGTPEHVYAHTQEALPGMNLSTVYRTLETLTEHGVVAHTHLNGPSATYMLASHGDHAHLVCRGCEAVFEVEDSLAGAFIAGISARHDFAVDSGHLSVFGLCAACSKGDTAAKTTPSGRHSHT